MKTYEQAVLNEWTVAYHRMKFAEEAKKQGENPDCRCADCKEHFAALKSQSTQGE